MVLFSAFLGTNQNNILGGFAVIGNDSISAMMQKALDGTWERQKAISNNIANHETPGYKAQKVMFEDALKKELKNLSSF